MDVVNEGRQMTEKEGMSKKRKKDFSTHKEKKVTMDKFDDHSGERRRRRRRKTTDSPCFE